MVAHGNFSENDECIARLIKEVDCSEHREVRTSNVLSAAQRRVEEDEMKTAEVKAPLA